MGNTRLPVIFHPTSMWHGQGSLTVEPCSHTRPNGRLKPMFSPSTFDVSATTRGLSELPVEFLEIPDVPHHQYPTLPQMASCILRTSSWPSSVVGL